MLGELEAAAPIRRVVEPREESLDDELRLQVQPLDAPRHARLKVLFGSHHG